MDLLTLSEIAKKYKRSPKTFKKHVLALGIPYELLGRSMMFDPVAVSNHLKAIHEERPEKSRVVRFTHKKVPTNRFAEALGI